MTFEEALKIELSTISELNERIYPLNALEGIKPPYLVYVSSEGEFHKTFDGYLNTKELSCEINILNSSYGSMKAIAKAVLEKLKSFQGRVIADNGPLIQNITFTDDSPELYENEVKLYRKMINIEVYFKEV